MEYHTILVLQLLLNRTGDHLIEMKKYVAGSIWRAHSYSSPMTSVFKPLNLVDCHLFAVNVRQELLARRITASPFF